MKKYSITLATILPIAMPVVFEAGTFRYAKESLDTPGERRLAHAEVTALLVAASFLQVFNVCIDREMDWDSTHAVLVSSLDRIPGLLREEAAHAKMLIEHFENFRIIRAEHAFDDWIGEALWPLFQSSPYHYPSAMSRLIVAGLDISRILDQCTIDP